MLKRLLAAALVGATLFTVGCGNDNPTPKTSSPAAEQQSANNATQGKVEPVAKVEPAKNADAEQDREYKQQIYQVLSSGDVQWKNIESASLAENEAAWHAHNEMLTKFSELASVKSGAAGSKYFDECYKVLEFRNKAFMNVVYCQKNYGKDNSGKWGKAKNDADEYIRKANDAYAALEKF